jgi:hypothetical protein
MSVAAAGIVSAGAVAVASPASASIGTGRIQLCSQGNYASDITWPGGLHTYVVAEGSCQTFNFPSQGVSYFTIGGWYNTNPTHFNIGTISANDLGGHYFGPTSAGMAYGTRGTTTSPYYVRWQ